MERINEMMPVEQIRTNPRNARTHAANQIRKLGRAMKNLGFGSPLLVDETNMLIAGHARLQAAKAERIAEVPVVRLMGLSAAKKRALMLAENRIAEQAGWDREVLSIELPELMESLVAEGLDIGLTGFEPPTIEQILGDFEEDATDPADQIPAAWRKRPAVTAVGDLWQLGRHRLKCGDARVRPDLADLMQGKSAAMAFLDPPYNLKIGEVVGRGRTKHAEFAMASGEMSRGEFLSFLAATLANAKDVSLNGAVHFVCMDWRHVDQLLSVGDDVYDVRLNLVVWVKSNAGQGSFYRSQHELIAVFRVGDRPHLNTIELGRHGRSRSNVWHYSGVNAFRAGRLDELKAHPTAKPVALIADAIKDCTRRRDIVLDSFAGSGSTILAAERVGRCAYGLEIEPRYVDVAIRRWQAFTRKDAVHVPSGQTFEDRSAGHESRIDPI